MIDAEELERMMEEQQAAKRCRDGKAHRPVAIPGDPLTGRCTVCGAITHAEPNLWKP